MKRPDLSGDGKFDGWQVLDPTPQEMSDGKTLSDSVVAHRDRFLFPQQRMRERSTRNMLLVELSVD